MSEAQSTADETERTANDLTAFQQHILTVLAEEPRYGLAIKRELQLHHEQFETLYGLITDAPTGFDLDRLPPDAEAYPTVLSLHPRFEVGEREGTITETDPETYTSTQLVNEDDAPTNASASDDAHTLERQEPDPPVYADALLFVDALERHDVTDLGQLETSDLVNLYTLLSDVQRGANDYRQEVTDVLLGRLHHDHPVHGQYGSVQQTARRR